MLSREKERETETKQDDRIWYNQSIRPLFTHNKSEIWFSIIVVTAIFETHTLNYADFYLSKNLFDIKCDYACIKFPGIPGWSDDIARNRDLWYQEFLLIAHPTCTFVASFRVHIHMRNLVSRMHFETTVAPQKKKKKIAQCQSKAFAGFRAVSRAVKIYGQRPRIKFGRSTYPKNRQSESHQVRW